MRFVRKYKRQLYGLTAMSMSLAIANPVMSQVGSDSVSEYSTKIDKELDELGNKISGFLNDILMVNENNDSVLVNSDIKLELLNQINLSSMGIPAGDYSGITRVKDDTYAVVSDKDKTVVWHLFEIKMDLDDGRIISVSESKQYGDSTDVYRDKEGIAYNPALNTFFVSGEADQEIIEYDAGGRKTGRKLQIPELFGVKGIEHNRGFESVTYNDKTKTYWTTTEGVLKADSVEVLRFLCFNENLLPVAQYAYKLDNYSIPKSSKDFVHGVADILALDDGRLIVLEREIYISNLYIGSYSNTKLYLVTPNEMSKVEDATVMSDLPSEVFMDKELLCDFTTHLNLGKMNFANYEGLCFGPRLNDGRQTLVLISDSQSGAGNSLYRLKDYIKVVILPALSEVAFPPPSYVCG